MAIGEAVEEGQVLLTLAPATAQRPPAPSGGAGYVEPASAPTCRGARAPRGRASTRRGPTPSRAATSTGRRTARENLADLVDEGTFVEYGPLLFAAQERRRSARGADRAHAGRRPRGRRRATSTARPCVVMSYDYTVLAGTQGMRNHLKKDRLFELAERRRLPVVLFAEGGGGRPGDVDMPIVAGLDCRAFALFAELSGLVPLVGIASGYCFAGNAALLGCCDVVIATEDASIGMGGPAMIEGGGLGVVRARGGRADRRAAGQRRRRPARRRRGRGGRARASATSPTSRGRADDGAASPTRRCCAS